MYLVIPGFYSTEFTLSILKAFIKTITGTIYLCKGTCLVVLRVSPSAGPVSLLSKFIAANPAGQSLLSWPLDDRSKVKTLGFVHDLICGILVCVFHYTLVT